MLLTQETHHTTTKKDTHFLQVKEYEKVFHANGNKNEQE